MSETHNPSGMRTGGIKAGGSIKADNIVTGVQIQGGDADTARSLLALAQHMESGGVEAVQDVIAQNIVTGLQYLGQNGTTPTSEQFQQELAALREQLAQAIEAGEIADAYEAEDAKKALDRAIEQTRATKPEAEKIATQLDRAATIIHKTATAAEALGKLQETVMKLAPVVTALKYVAGLLF